jgi:phosphoribosyl 1,2-cyclic phosphate phosphodiesterase
MEALLTFLGTGTSMGVPTLGCECAVCQSADPRDRRMRPSGLVRWHEEGRAGGRERVVVIDTGPDFREQALRAGLRRVDAVFYTHSHADHILGLDDLRPLSFLVAHEGGQLPLFVTPETRKVLERIFDYTFAPDATYPNRARVQLEDLNGGAEVHGVRFTPVPVLHGTMQITGYRFGNTAYLTDVSEIPETSFPLLEGVECMVLSALRHKPHPTHASVEQAVAWAQRIGARQTWFTHIAHDLGHEETNRALPTGMRLAYDGLSVPIRLGPVSGSISGPLPGPVRA